MVRLRRWRMVGSAALRRVIRRGEAELCGGSGEGRDRSGSKLLRTVGMCESCVLRVAIGELTAITQELGFYLHHPDKSLIPWIAMAGWLLVGGLGGLLASRIKVGNLQPHLLSSIVVSLIGSVTGGWLV